MLLFLSVVSIFALGYLAQTTGLCMVRGVKQATAGKPMFLIAILFSGTLAWIAMGIGERIPVEGRVQAYWPSIYSFIGGMLFGVGASVNGGCGVSTVSRLARGELVMTSTIFGWLAGWIIFLPLLSFSDTKSEITLFDGGAVYAVSPSHIGPWRGNISNAEGQSKTLVIYAWNWPNGGYRFCDRTTLDSKWVVKIN